MKKILLVLSTMILCIFCLASCNDKDNYLKYEEAVRKNPTPANAYQLVSGSMQKLEETGKEGGSIKMTADLSFSISGIKTSMEMKFDAGWTKDSLFESMDLGKFGGKTEVVYADGVMYCSKEEDGKTTRYRASMSREELKDEISDIMSSSGSYGQPSDTLSDLELKEEDFKNADINVSDENITITLNALETEVLKDLFGEILGELGEYSPDIGKATVSIVIDKDADINKLSFTMSFDSEIAGKKATVIVIANMDIEKPGVIPEIKAPDDIYQYEDLSLNEEETEAFKMYKKAINDLIKDDAYSVTVKSSAKVGNDTSTATVETKLNGDKVHAIFSNESNSNRTHLIYVDGVAYLYQTDNSKKYKFSIDAKSFKEQYGLENGGMIYLKRSDFKGAYATDKTRGKTIYINSSSISDIAVDKFTDAFDGYDFSVSRASMSVMIDKSGKITGESYLFSGSVRVRNKDYKVSISIDESINSNDPEIEAPANSSEYEEIDA